jgi:predicted dehydrogenase
MEGAEIVGIADLDTKRAHSLAKRYGIGRVYDNYPRLLEQELDFVVLCTPTNLHARMIVDCCLHGKHVLVEKPLAHDVQGALEAIRASRQQGVKICVVQNYRYYSAVRRARDLIASGRLGNVLSMIAVGHTPSPMGWTRSGWLYKGGGVLDDFGPHMYDFLAWFAGAQPRVVFASGYDATQGMQLVNYAHIGVQFANKINGAVDLSWLCGSRIVSMDVYGTGGRLHINVGTDTLEEAHGIADPISELTGSWGRAFHTLKEAAFGRLLVGGIAYYDQVYADFIGYIEGSAPAPVSVIDSLRAVQIMDYARLSILQDKAVIVPLLEDRI